MADEKKTKLEIVKAPDFITNISEAICKYGEAISEIGSECGKKMTETLKKYYENMGYEFKEVEYTPEETPKDDIKSDKTEQLDDLQNTNTNGIDAYIKHLRDIAYIKNDGKTTNHGLGSIGLEICRFTGNHIKKSQLEIFVRKNGKKYAEPTIKNAVTEANSKFDEEQRTENSLKNH